LDNLEFRQDIFSEILKNSRGRLGMTQSFVASSLSISRRNYQRIEQGNSEPSVSTVFSLAKLFGINPATLLGFSDHDESDGLNKESHIRKILNYFKEDCSMNYGFCLPRNYAFGSPTEMENGLDFVKFDEISSKIEGFSEFYDDAKRISSPLMKWTKLKSKKSINNHSIVLFSTGDLTNLIIMMSYNLG
jgi:transcriptional regulator with XRE-family HTH domain